MASKSKGSVFDSRGWKIGMKYLYGWGAAVVILGALFKILHLPGANEMLIVGMGTETVVFFFSAFEPLPAEDKHWDWDKVFPQLNEEIDPLDEIELEEEGRSSRAMIPGFGGNMPEINIDPELFDQLKVSVDGLKNNVDQMADISDATLATNDFSSKLRTATEKVDMLNDGYGTTVEAMGAFSSSITAIKNNQEQLSTDIEAYHASIKGVTGNLDALNSVYEIELQDAQKHLTSINKFYGSISGVMQNLLDTSKDTDQLRQEVGQLSQNMSALNTIYGNMLSAMASGVRPSNG